MTDLTRRSVVTAVVVSAAVILAGATAGRPAPSAARTPGSETVVVHAGDPTGATLNHALVGVDGPGPQLPAVDANMTALGLSWVRTDVGFESSYDCTTKTWDPTSLDARVGRIEGEGAAALAIVDYTPSCLAPFTELPPGGDPSYEPPDTSSADRAVWDSLVREMALHEIANGVCAFEIWNEPDGTFWYGSLPGYLALYEDTATVLEQAAQDAQSTGDDPCAKVEVGGPGLLFSDSSWIEPFLAFVSANALPLDFLSWHYYGNYPSVGPVFAVPGAPPPASEVPPDSPVPYWYNPALRAQTYAVQVAQVRSEVAHFPTLHPKLWIDEWNVDAGYDARMSGAYDGAFVASVLQAVQGAGLDRMAFFDVADSATDANQNWGLLDSAGQAKPAYMAMRYWGELQPSLVETTLAPGATGDPAAGGVSVLSSRAAGGTSALSVLLSNFVAYDPTGDYGTTPAAPGGLEVDLKLVGLEPGLQYSWSRLLVDAAHPGGAVVDGGVLEGPLATLSFPLPADGVSLVLLQRNS